MIPETPSSGPVGLQKRALTVAFTGNADVVPETPLNKKSRLLIEKSPEQDLEMDHLVLRLDLASTPTKAAPVTHLCSPAPTPFSELKSVVDENSLWPTWSFLRDQSQEVLTQEQESVEEGTSFAQMPAIADAEVDNGQQVEDMQREEVPPLEVVEVAPQPLPTPPPQAPKIMHTFRIPERPFVRALPNTTAPARPPPAPQRETPRPPPEPRPRVAPVPVHLVPLTIRPKAVQPGSGPQTKTQISAQQPVAVPGGEKKVIKQKFYEGGVRPGALTSTAEGFVENYLNSSRLHHLSTWKMEFRNLVQEETERVDRRPHVQMADISERVIMHVDMDCFFASVSLRDRPSLKDKPVGISHSKGGDKANSGSIASCNYVARAEGVKNGMFVGEAKRRCPGLVLLPYEFDKYKGVSEKLYRVLVSFADQIQAVSCDEALLDVSSRVLELGDEEAELALAKDIRKKIEEETACVASVGIAHNILLARIATKKAKPNGQFFLSNNQEDIAKVMDDMVVGDLPGVGWTLKAKLKEIGVLLCRDLKAISKERLMRDFGQKTGETLYNSCRGVDTRMLVTNQQRKTVGAEVNWGMRFETTDQVQAFVRELVREVTKRLTEAKFMGRIITIKVKRVQANAGTPIKFLGHGLCDSFSRSVTLASATSSPDVIYREAWALYQILKVPDPELRGMGIHLSRLEPPAAGEVAQPTLKFSRVLSAPAQTDPPTVPEESERTATGATDLQGHRVAPVAPLDHQRGSSSESGEDVSSDEEEEELDPDVLKAIRQSKGKGKVVPPSTNLFVRETGDDAEDLPPPQILDYETFSELPHDIQHEVVKSFKIAPPATATTSASSSSSVCFPPAPQATAPTTPRHPDAFSSANNPTSSPPVSQTPLNLPPLSQLDVVTLLELPEKQRVEVLQYYAKQQQLQQTRNKSPPQVARPPPLALPLKPTAQKRKHQPAAEKPQKKRGRPRKEPERAASPPPDIQLPSLSQVDPTVMEELPSQLQRQIRTVCQRNEAKKKKETAAADPMTAALHGTREKAPHSDPSSLVSQSRGDLRSILCEWISSTKSPCAEDATTVLGFLLHLIEDLDLERLATTLKFLHRMTQGKQEWGGVVTQITTEVKEKVRAKYGSDLAL